MPLLWKQGNIFESKAELLVNPVNCLGVSGAGLAKQFAQRFPGLEEWWKKQCKGPLRITPGDLRVFNSSPKVLCFPTKDHWARPSRIEFIECGLHTLVGSMSKDIYFPPSMAIPPLGCGLGGLEWKKVRKLIQIHLGDWTGDIEIYEP